MDSTHIKPRRRARLVWKIAAIAILVITLGYVGISLTVAHVLTRTNNRPNATEARQLGGDVLPWSTRTADGLTLRGWYCPTREQRRLIVLVHGMGGSLDEMAGIARDLHHEGYDVLLFDLRGHGASDESRLFMGARERGDLRAVLDWAGRRGYPPDRIGWVAHSMGASTVLMEAARNAKITAAVLDSPFGNLPELLDRQLTEHSHLPRVFNPGILAAARLAFGVRTDNLIPMRSARDWGRRPMLLIHGEADSVVPVSQARQIADNAGPTCRALYLPGVEHVAAYRRQPDRYIAAVDRFFDRNLSP